MAKIEVINGNATIDPVTGEINVTAEKGVTTKVDTGAKPAPAAEPAAKPAGPATPVMQPAPTLGTLCPSCGAPLLPGAHFCSKCGLDFAKAQPVIFCAHCGKPLPYAKAPYCPSCGAHLLPDTSERPVSSNGPAVINVGEPAPKVKPDKFKKHAGHILGEGISMFIFFALAVTILILGAVLDTYPYAIYGLAGAAVLALAAGIFAKIQVKAKNKVFGILCFIFMAVVLGAVSLALVYSKSGAIEDSFYAFEYKFIMDVVGNISNIMNYLGSSAFWLNLAVLICLITGAILSICAFFWSLSFMIKAIHRKPEAEPEAEPEAK
jgi:hypothetical protein